MASHLYWYQKLRIREKTAKWLKINQTIKLLPNIDEQNISKCAKKLFNIELIARMICCKSIFTTFITLE